MFFSQWDEEKYSNLATMLFNNYIQALEIIEENTRMIAEAQMVLNFSEEDIENWLAEESANIKTLGQESKHDIYAATYVENLIKLEGIEYATFITQFEWITESEP